MASVPPVLFIIVGQETLDRYRAGARDAAYDLVDDVDLFVSRMVGECGYVPAELPAEATWSGAVNRYAGEVANGGHWQFAGNTGWTPDIVAACAGGLAAIGVDVFRETFARFVAFVESHPEALARMRAQQGHAGEQPEVEALDDAFYGAGGSQALMHAQARWIAALPCLRVLTHEAAQAEYGRLREANPLLAERLAARQARQAAGQARDIHLQAARQLGALADPKIEVHRWNAASFHATKAWKQTYRIRLETDRGPAMAALGRERSALYIGSHDDLSKVETGSLPPPSWLDWLLRRAHPTRPVVHVETAVLEAILARDGLSVRDLVDRAQ